MYKRQGFLLPMLYSGFLGMSTMQGLALSFFAFLISGVLGTYNYYRAKNLDLKLAVWISIGKMCIRDRPRIPEICILGFLDLW